MQHLTNNGIINSLQDQPIGNYIDEQFSITETNKSPALTILVEEEMRAEGLDPLNKDDVKSFWASKGISS